MIINYKLHTKQWGQYTTFCQQPIPITIIKYNQKERMKE